MASSSTPYAIKTFASQAVFRAWLAAHHADTDGIWLRMYKKGTGVASVTYDQALDVALCYGWIDGQLKSYDDESYIQKFTPRRTRSNWSKRNTEHVARLIKSGEMRAAGLREVEAAKADGRWAAAYDAPSQATLPQDFLRELKKDATAYAYFKTLSKANVYAIAYRLQTAKKPETRERRMKQILLMLSEGKKFH